MTQKKTDNLIDLAAPVIDLMVKLKLCEMKIKDHIALIKENEKRLDYWKGKQEECRMILMGKGE